MNIEHDLFQTGIDFFFGPAQFYRVLCHFQSAYRNTASIGCLTRSVEDFGFEELFDGLGSGGHVGAFRYGETAIGKKSACIVAVDFVLSGRGHGDIAFFIPRTGSFDIFTTVFFGVFADTAAVNVFQFEDISQFFGVDTVGIVDVTIAIGHSDDFRAEADQFLYRVLCNVTRTGNSNHFAFDVDVAGFQHFEQEIYVSVTGRFGTNERTSEFEAFSGERSGIFPSQFFVHAVHITHFATAHTYITGRNVGLRTDVSPQFGNEGLAEAHDFGIGFTARAEIRTSFTSTHGECGQ